ncbi:MAG: DUF6034 family protein [Eubacteriales bacterium]|nr:DUF6034 family protein [Eubacteriales bacterium]
MKFKQWIQRFFLWIGAVGMLFALGGCGGAVRTAAANPVSLEAAQMVETASQSQTSSGASTAAPSPVDQYTTLGAPKTYAAELQSETGFLKVHVNAAVELQNMSLPVERTKLHRFTDEGAARFAQVLLGKNAQYIDDSRANEHFTKAYLQREIDDLSDSIAHWDAYGSYKYDLRYDTKNEAEDALAEFQALLPALPDALPAITPDFSNWKMISASNDQGAIETTDCYQCHFAMPDNATVSRFAIHNCPEVLSSCFLEYARNIQRTVGAMSLDFENVEGLITVTQENAEAQARAVVDALGYPEFVCVHRQACLSDYRDFAYYRFFFLRQIDGAETLYWNSSSYADENFELIQVCVDNGGILKVSYNNPQDILGEMTPAADLLPFSQIQSVFEKMILVVDNQTEAEAWNRDGMPKLTKDYYISSVRLGLSSVAESNNADTRLLIPVWSFFGYEESRVNDGEPERLGTNGQRALLTINAIDGTVIEQS